MKSKRRPFTLAPPPPTEYPLHAATLGDLWERTRADLMKEGRVCPVCLDSISDRATTFASGWRF